MNHASLTLGSEWSAGEWPAYVFVTHGRHDGARYVPERTCLPVYDGKWRNTPKCSICGELLTDGVLKLPKHCSECGAKVVGE